MLLTNRFWYNSLFTTTASRGEQCRCLHKVEERVGNASGQVIEMQHVVIAISGSKGIFKHSTNTKYGLRKCMEGFRSKRTRQGRDGSRCSGCLQRPKHPQVVACQHDPCRGRSRGKRHLYKNRRSHASAKFTEWCHCTFFHNRTQRGN